MTNLQKGCKNYIYNHPETIKILRFMYSLPPQEELTTSDIMLNLGIDISNIRHYQILTRRLQEYGLLKSRYINSTRSCNRVRLYRIGEMKSNDISELLNEFDGGDTKT